MRGFVPGAVFVASSVFVSIAAAQSSPTGSSAAALASAPAAARSADADSPAAAVTPTKPVVPATGYSYGALATASPTQPVPGPRRRTPAIQANPNGPDALMPGFETLADGSTRLFVDLSKPAAYDTKPGRAAITYVLKGVRVDRRNNQNPLVTIHFNTPVASARLVPHGRDLWFVVDLRADVQPTATMDATKDGAATLRVVFPKGAYLPPEPNASPSTASGGEANPPPYAATASMPDAKPSERSVSPASP